MSYSRRPDIPQNKAVAFDLDGTLFKDSVRYWVEAAKRTIQAFGLNVPAWAIERILAHDPMRISEFGLPESRVLEFRDQYREQARLLLTTAQAPNLKPLHKSLQRLKDARIHTAIATSAPEFWMVAAMAYLQIEPYIDFPVSRDMVDDATAKPHPRQLEIILDHFQVPPSRAVMVGDTYSDLGAGHRAKVGKNILVRHRGNEKLFPWQLVNKHKDKITHIVYGVDHAVDVILGQTR